jgi:hypothetical protein
MSVKFRITAEPGRQYSWSCERLIDHARFDFATGTFQPPPAVPAEPMRAAVEESGFFLGRYRGEYGPTPGEAWWEGDYAVTVHQVDRRAPDGSALPVAVLVEFPVRMRKGEGGAYFPPSRAW